MKIIKRDGRIVEYNREKIRNAIMHANNDVIEANRANKRQIDNIIKHIEELNKKRMLVEDIQDMIETELMKIKKYDLAKAYIIYRYKRALVRKSNITDESILSLIKNNNENNDTKGNNIISIQRDLIASEVSKDLTKRVLLPEKISEAHKNGILYFHHDDYFLQPIINSCSINLEEMLENDIIINDNILAKPTNFREACITLSQIILNISINQAGEQAINIKHLSKYLKLSKEQIIENIKEIKQISIQDILDKELQSGIKCIMNQINSLSVIRKKIPIVTLYLSIDEDDNFSEYTKLIIKEIFKQYANLYKNNNNNIKLVYILNETNKENDDLTKETIKIINNHLPITFISSKIMKENYNTIYLPIGYCQMLPPYKDKNNELKYEGRFNQGIVSLNLPQIGLESSNEDDFWSLLDERLDLCFEALMCKYHSLLGTLSNISPIHWQNGGISRLIVDEKIDTLLKNNYSTLSLSYCGLNELVKLIKKVDLTNKEGEKFAIKLLKFMRSKCDLWKKDTSLGFNLIANYDYNLCYHFANIDKEKYGIIKDINDKEYYNKTYYLDDFNDKILEKIKIESNLLNICSGGGIININTNEHNIEDVIKFIYNNTLCSEINNINKGEL